MRFLRVYKEGGRPMLCHSISASLLSFDIGISSQTSSQRRNLSFDHLLRV